MHKPSLQPDSPATTTQAAVQSAAEAFARAVDRVRNAQTELTDAQVAYIEAKRSLGELLVPEDAPEDREFATWIGNTLFIAARIAPEHYSIQRSFFRADQREKEIHLIDIAPSDTTNAT